MIAAFPNPSLPNDNPLFDFTQWNFPNLNFTCNGYIVKWRLRVNATMESINQRPVPHITTWRLQNSFGSRSNYVLNSSTNESQINVTEISGSVYIEYTPPSPVPIQKEDFIGIMMPVDDNDRAQSVRPLFLRLPEGNSSTISCVKGGDSQLLFLQDRMCASQQQLSQYIPLVSAIFSELLSYIARFIIKDPPLIRMNKWIQLSISLDNDTSSTSTSLPPTTALTSTQPATTMDPTPPANPATTPQDTNTGSVTVDLAAPPQSGADSNQLVGVIIGALLAALSLVLIVVLAIFLVLLLTKRRGEKLYDVPVPPQPQNMNDTILSQTIDSQSIEVKNNEAYFLSTTQKIPTVDNIAYASSPATSQIPTENNVAYDQAMSQLQPTIGDNVAYGQREDDYATVSEPTEYDYVL